MTRVKICGIKTLEEARMVIEHGAWAMGEVFAPSPRRISIEQAEKINRQLGKEIIKIGVFVNEEIDSLKYIIKTCSLDMVQLHGEEAPEYVRELNLPVIKSFSVNEPIERSLIEQWPVWAYLFDAYSPALRGGSGKSFNWRWLAEVRLGLRIILAGGLNPGNAGHAIKAVKPMAVDVSSGVEFPGGGKSGEKIEQFLAAVKEADKNIGFARQETFGLESPPKRLIDNSGGGSYHGL